MVVKRDTFLRYLGLVPWGTLKISIKTLYLILYSVESWCNEWNTGVMGPSVASRWGRGLLSGVLFLNFAGVVYSLAVSCIKLWQVFDNFFIPCLKYFLHKNEIKHLPVQIVQA